MLDILLKNILEWPLYFMQVSIVVPMVVVWWRRRYFSAPVRLLSWYVYLSAFCALGARLGAWYLHNNLAFLIGFNIFKIALFAAVYLQVLTSARLRRILRAASAIVLVALTGLTGLDQMRAIDISRVTQCALLAGFALVYLEQTLTRTPGYRIFRDPLWLLSVGQLVYSAGTVTAFSLEMIGTSSFVNDIIYVCVSLAGLAFNAFLTLAFLRAQPNEPTATNSELAYQRIPIMGS